jgi:hypothetical protein
MPSKPNQQKKAFNPEITKILLEPEQAVLGCCGKSQSAMYLEAGRCCTAPSSCWCLPHSAAKNT